jgi:hypothetical protein
MYWCSGFVTIYEGIDSLCLHAEEARKQILRRTGNAQLVERLVPLQAADQRDAQRGRILFGAIFKDLSRDDIALRVTLQPQPPSMQVKMVQMSYQYWSKWWVRDRWNNVMG